jgi:hypothetical protein
MRKVDLHKKLAYLESINDMLVTELEHIDSMMKQLGFANGISTLKSTAEDMISKGYIPLAKNHN